MFNKDWLVNVDPISVYVFIGHKAIGNIFCMFYVSQGLDAQELEYICTER